MTTTTINDQSVFAFYSALEQDACPPRRPGKAKDSLSKMDYDMLLTRALHRHTLSHPVYAVLVTTAHGALHQPEPYSIAGIAARLGIAYHSVVWHLRKYPDLFIVLDHAAPFRVLLSVEGRQLLTDIHRSLQLYRTPPAAP